MRRRARKRDCGGNEYAAAALDPGRCGEPAHSLHEAAAGDGAAEPSKRTRRESASQVALGIRHEGGRQRKAASFLCKLHACLQHNFTGDALRWLDDGVRFTVRLREKGAVALWFGSTALEIRRMLEALDFQLQEQRGPSEVLVATHSEFSRWAIPNIAKMTSRSSSKSGCDNDELLQMPEVSYNPALNPLEVRVKCSGAAQSSSESWQVVVASSLKTAAKAEERAERCLELRGRSGCDSESDGGEKSSSTEDDECLWCPLFAASSCEDKDPESYRWISRSSESSSLCLDDLTDIDILSQISTYFS